jgi:hypothetical protein
LGVALNQPEANGKAFLGLIKYIKLNGRLEYLDQILRATEPATRQVFSKKIMVSDWYPYSTFINFLATMQSKMSNGDPNFFRLVGSIGGRADMGAIFSIFKRLASFEKLFRSCNSIWSSYYRNAGSMIPTEWKPERTVVQIINFPQMSPLHCRLMEGWFVATLEEIGVRLLRWEESKCMSKGDPCHEFACSWQKR